MRSHMTRLVAVLALFIAVPGSAAAQQPAASALSVFERAAGEEQLLRVTTSAGLSFEGRVRAVDAQAAQIDSVRVPLTDVVRIERGEAVGSGGRAGMLAGAVIVGTMFVVLSYTISDDPDFDVSTAGPIALAGVVTGAILGGLVGGELDPPRVDWREIWPVAVSW